MGLHRAFPDAEIIGFDIKPQPHYPFKFYQKDVMKLELHLMGYDFAWASPPCQHYTQMLNHGLTDRRNHPDLIAKIRRGLNTMNIPFVIENVAGAPLKNPVMLCGEMFGLRVTRHRFFESNFSLPQTPHPKHRGTGHRKQGDGGYYFRVYGHETGKRGWGKAMGIDWMKTPELAQAIPPAYSEWIGKQLILWLNR